MSTPSIQHLLAESMLRHFPDALIKKKDVDNFLDMHVPSIHQKKGTHIFFNTSNQKIKIGFYCREEEFVEQALSNGAALVEKYSQGVRLKDNPEFADVETAIAATLKFMEVLGQKSVPSGGAKQQKTETYTFKKAVDAYLQGNIDYVAAYVQAGNPVLQFNGDTLITNELISYVCTYTEVDQRIVDLVESGVDLNESFDDGEGYTAVHFAAWDGKDEILTYLLEAGAEADLVGEDGYTPIFLAAAGGHLDCVGILVEYGVDVNRRLKDDNIYFSKQGGTPLTLAFINGFLDMALFLIEQGADQFVLVEPCKGAPSPNLFVNFLSLVQQCQISAPADGQLSKILSLVGLEENESFNRVDSKEEALESSGQLDLNEFLKELGAGDGEEESSEEKETEATDSEAGLDLASFLASMELEEDADDSEEEEEDDEEEEGGFPMISYRKPAEEMNKVVQQYLRHWQKSSQIYAWRKGIKAFIPEFVSALVADKVCPIFTTKDIEAICSRIKSEKIIPILGYVPEEFYGYTKRVWWLVPFCIWKEDTASLVFIDKNGFYGMCSQDGEEVIDTIFNWDSVYELDFEYSYDGDPNINRLTLTQEDGNYLTFDEFVSTSEEDNHGSYLAVIEAIWEARRETIEASKGEPFWAEGAGGEGFVEFDTPQDLLKAAAWDNPNRPDPSMFGG